MRKDQSLIDESRQVITFQPMQLLLPEVFIDITPDKVPGIRGYYMISNYGRIWHKYKAKFLSVNLDTKGYMYKPLATINGNKNFRVHRLVMTCFNYFPGCENYLVNHRDGIKSNNYIGNLEWATPSENVIHAYSTGLNNVKYSNEVIEKVCYYLQEGTKTYNQIMNELNVSYSMIQSINQKRSHTDISDKYDIKLRKINNNFTTEEIHSICKFFQDNPYNKETTLKEYYHIALSSLGYTNPSTVQIRSVEKIYKKISFTYISNYYKF